MEKDHYVIAAKARGNNGEVKGAYLLKVNSISKGVVYGTAEKNRHISQLRAEVEVPKSQIILDLGTDPAPGKLHGVNVGTRYHGKKFHDEFGHLFFFYAPDDEKGPKIRKAFDKAYKTLKHNRLDMFIEPERCIWEILPYHGEKYSGMYMRPRDEKLPHRFQVRPEIGPLGEVPSVIYHELGHFIHLNYMTSEKLNADWLRVYNTTINVQPITREVSKRLLENLLSQEDAPSDFKGQLDADDAIAFKWIARAIKQEHNLSLRELDILFQANYKDDIKELWPSRVTSRDLAPIITDYATVNYKELFAESFMLYLLGELESSSERKKIAKLMEKSISFAKANRERE